METMVMQHADRIPIGRGIAPLADIPDREGGDGGPELVIRANTA